MEAGDTRPVYNIGISSSWMLLWRSAELSGRMNPLFLVPFSLSLVQAIDQNNSSKVHHGCLVKEQRRVSSYETQLSKISTSSVEQCAKVCAERSDCDSFDVNQNKCRTFRKGHVGASKIVSSTAGLCPKGLWQHIFRRFRIII